LSRRGSGKAIQFILTQQGKTESELGKAFTMLHQLASARVRANENLESLAANLRESAAQQATTQQAFREVAVQQAITRNCKG